MLSRSCILRLVAQNEQHSGVESFGCSWSCKPRDVTMLRCHRLLCVLFIVLGLAMVASDCRDAGPSPTQPSPTQPSPTQPSGNPANLAGMWSGSASDSSGPGQLTWQLTQTGTSLTGTLVITDTGTGYSGRGTVSGTLSGSSIGFSMSVPSGGFDGPYASCTASLSGDGQATSSSIMGTYSGSNSCSGAIASGQLTLNKQ